jgi:hypothetical protein
MALAKYSGDCAPVTMTLPPKMKQGTPSMPASLAPGMTKQPAEPARSARFCVAGSTIVARQL